jgi:hypothetical protein
VSDVGADERGLGRLAREQAEGRQVAHRVAGEHGGERVAEPQPVRRLEAQRPRGRAQREARAGNRHDSEEAPADRAQIVEDLLRPDAPHVPREEREPCRRRDEAREIQPGSRTVRRHAVII